jgi:hypothetical protein
MGPYGGGRYLNRRPPQLIDAAGFVTGARQHDRFPLHLWHLPNTPVARRFWRDVRRQTIA